jgi:prepilin-type N-terminal cleavage/methylation domain-containing protein
MKLINNLQFTSYKLGFNLKRKAFEGFTLIELLVTISIIAIISTVLLANFNAARERGRDAQRKADLRNLQTALRLYYNDFGYYPDGTTAGVIKGCGVGGAYECPWRNPGQSFAADGKVYMSSLPKDPLPIQDYHYEQTDADTYSLKACLENKSDDKCGTDHPAWCPATAGCVYTVNP